MSAAIGVGLQLFGAGANLAGMIAQRKKEDDATRAAVAAVADAKRFIEVNRMEGIQIPLEAYEEEQRQLTARGVQTVSALQEAGSRGLAAGIGKAEEQLSKYGEQIRKNMAKDLLARQKDIAAEQSRIDSALATISLETSEGAQKAAADAAEATGVLASGALTGLGGAALSAYQAMPLFGKQPTSPVSPVSPVSPFNVQPLQPFNYGFNRQSAQPDPFVQKYLYEPLEIPGIGGQMPSGFNI